VRAPQVRFLDSASRIKDLDLDKPSLSTHPLKLIPNNRFGLQLIIDFFFFGYNIFRIEFHIIASENQKLIKRFQRKMLGKGIRISMLTSTIAFSSVGITIIP
jgi:hypothetical protein